MQEDLINLALQKLVRFPKGRLAPTHQTKKQLDLAESIQFSD